MENSCNVPFLHMINIIHYIAASKAYGNSTLVIKLNPSGQLNVKFNLIFHNNIYYFYYYYY